MIAQKRRWAVPCTHDLLSHLPGAIVPEVSPVARGAPHGLAAALLHAVVDETTPLAAHFALWGCGGMLMALVMALVTWQGARRLASSR
jgi:hypothetical protein